MDLTWLLVGAMAGALAVWLNARRAAHLRPRYPKYEAWSWAAFLVIAALIYVGFALFHRASAGWTAIELAGLVGYGLIAWVGAARRPVLIGIGWILHVLWDQLLHPGGHPGFVPAWYVSLCLGFDVSVGVTLLFRFRAKTDG